MCKASEPCYMTIVTIPIEYDQPVILTVSFLRFQAALL